MWGIPSQGQVKGEAPVSKRTIRGEARDQERRKSHLKPEWPGRGTGSQGAPQCPMTPSLPLPSPHSGPEAPLNSHGKEKRLSRVVLGPVCSRHTSAAGGTPKSSHPDPVKCYLPRQEGLCR